MHAGNIDNDTAAGRVYRALLKRGGVWADAYELMLEAQTSALSTRVSEVRHALRDRGGLERVEHKQVGHKHYYRIVQTGEAAA